ncbi:MAG TPA: hypothetical protein VIH59_15970 [Candidatus Tectomicrobia bacterium]
MHTVERTVLWGSLVVLAIFALVINGRVNGVETIVQNHTSVLNQPAVDAAVFPGVPAAFAERWSKATAGKNVTPQDYLWLTIQLTNSGQSYVGELAAELALLPTLSAVYPYSASSWNAPKVVEGGQDKTQVKLTFPGLAQGDAHTVFLAVRPAQFGEPPYEPQDKLQWADQHQLYWKTLRVTAGDSTEFVQYGLASDWLPVMQQAARQ